MRGLRRFIGHAVLLAGLAVALPHGAAIAGQAGQVVLALGDTRVGSVTGIKVVAGLAVGESDRLETGADGHLHIRLADNGLLILRPNSSAVVTDYVFDPADAATTRMRITVSKGTVRSITGDWAKRNPERFRINTPVAALGVRGTDFSVFTDATTTRASVNSGGIVMTPLGGSCQSDGFGPCEGKLATDLFAGNQRAVMQANAGGNKPEIVDGYKNGTHPDKLAPPSPAEPALPTPPVNSSLNLRPDREALTASALEANAGALEVDTGKIQKPLVKWGHWETLLDKTNPSDIPVGRTRVASNPHFALYRDQTPGFVMPHEGTASFQLKEHESYIHDLNTGRLMQAAVNNARLSVDFGKQTFATSFDVSAEHIASSVWAKGGFFPDGRFVSSAISSNATISGALAGENASQAGMLFKHRIDDKITAYGATYWTR